MIKTNKHLSLPHKKETTPWRYFQEAFGPLATGMTPVTSSKLNLPDMNLKVN
jgi:hypothetical protein